MEKYLSVTTLTKYLKMKFDKDPYLERVYLLVKFPTFVNDLLTNISP